MNMFRAANAAKTRYHRMSWRALTATLGGWTAVLQIKQMIQQSNNESWALIVQAIRHQRLRDHAASIGIDYNWTYNTLPPAETARTLALLHDGKLLNGAHTAQLLSYMQHTNYETLIPAAVPPGIRVFTNTGCLTAPCTTRASRSSTVTRTFLWCTRWVRSGGHTGTR